MTGSRAGSGWVGEIVVGKDWLEYAGAIGPTEIHQHHAVQIVSSEGLVLEDSAGVSKRVTVAVIPPDTPHRVSVGCRSAVFLYIDGESNSGRRLAMLVARSGADAWAEAGTLLGELAPGAPVELRRALGRTAAVTERQPRPRHPAVVQALRLLEGPEAPTRVRSLAEAVGVSPRWLRQAFRESTGLPPRAYLRWRRIREAARAIAAGANLTRAAHEAGFVDSAHFNRVFHEFFGIAPSRVMGAVRWSLSRDALGPC